MNNNDLIKENDTLKLLNMSLSQLVNSLSESKVIPKYFQTDLESKFLRFFMTNLSILKLVEGIEFDLSSNTHFTRDIFSIYSLCRMQIENFIVMKYLFFDDVSEEEKEFRYDIYKLHGLLKQSNFTVSKSENQEKKDLVLEEINIIKSKITESLIFKEANQKFKSNYLSPNYALLYKKDNLFKSYGLTKLNIDGAWSLYSNHSHSEHIGDRQFNFYYGIEKSTDKAMISSLMTNSVLTAKLCNLMLVNFESAVTKFNAFSLSDKILIKKYNF